MRRRILTAMAVMVAWMLLGSHAGADDVPAPTGDQADAEQPATPGPLFPGAPWFRPSASYDQNFPDPHVLFHDGTYYAYSTNTGGPQLPAMTSPDLDDWTAAPAWSPNPYNNDPFYADRLVRTPDWAASVGGQAEVWAPAVLPLAGRWLAYYAIRATNGSRPLYCISVAAGPGPLGPFQDSSAEPITCGFGPAGAIDPWVYVDGAGTPWLLWKTEPFDAIGFLPDTPAAIWSQALEPNGLALRDDSAARILLTANASGWEAGIIENPSLFEMGGRLHLYYSGNRFDTPFYATGWATCSSPAGPCQRAQSGPIIVSGPDFNGPGGASVFTDGNGDRRVAYHAWNAPYTAYPSFPGCDTDQDGVCADQGQRFLHIGLVCELPGGTPHIGFPLGWRFCDVDPASWFGDEVNWLTDVGITEGATEFRFLPTRELTRAELVTMMWRWAGTPAVAGGSGFTDVPAGTFFTQAVAWAAQVGVVRGATDTTFSPHARISRGEVAAILHRVAASPPASGPPGYGDVPADAFFAPGVAWLTEAGVVTGFTATVYGPAEPVDRAQFAAMLCRFTQSTAPQGAGAIVGTAGRCPA